MRTILKVNRFTSTSWMLDTLKWLNVRERLQVNTIYFIRKMKIGDASDYLTEQLPTSGRFNHTVCEPSWTSGFNKLTPQQSKNHCFIKD